MYMIPPIFNTYIHEATDTIGEEIRNTGMKIMERTLICYVMTYEEDLLMIVEGEEGLNIKVVYANNICAKHKLEGKYHK